MWCNCNAILIQAKSEQRLDSLEHLIFLEGGGRVPGIQGNWGKLGKVGQVAHLREFILNLPFGE